MRRPSRTWILGAGSISLLMLASGVAAIGGAGGAAAASAAPPVGCEYAVDGGYVTGGSQPLQVATYWWRRDARATKNVVVARKSSTDGVWHMASSLPSLGTTATYGGSVTDSVGGTVPIDLAVMMPEGWSPPSGWNWNRWQSQGGVQCKRVPNEWIDAWDVVQRMSATGR